jgi:microcystin-dependent protein
MSMFGGAVPPEGYLLCNGAEIKRADYPALFTAIGTTWGAGDGSTTFRLPDLQSRFPVGKGAATWSDALNEKGGNKDSVLPAHKHITPAHIHPITHQHPGATTDNASPWHYHSMDHDHPNVVTDIQGNHNHYSSGDSAVNVLGAVAGGIQMDTGNGGPNAPTFAYYTFTSAAGNHQHNVDVPYYSGTTGWSDAAHAHNVTVPQFTGNSGSGGSGDTTTEGVSGVDANLPPYVTVNFIIKI